MCRSVLEGASVQDDRLSTDLEVLRVVKVARKGWGQRQGRIRFVEIENDLDVLKVSRLLDQLDATGWVERKDTYAMFDGPFDIPVKSVNHTLHVRSTEVGITGVQSRLQPSWMLAEVVYYDSYIRTNWVGL